MLARAGLQACYGKTLRNLCRICLADEKGPVPKDRPRCMQPMRATLRGAWKTCGSWSSSLQALLRSWKQRQPFSSLRALQPWRQALQRAQLSWQRASPLRSWRVLPSLREPASQLPLRQSSVLPLLRAQPSWWPALPQLLQELPSARPSLRQELASRLP